MSASRSGLRRPGRRFALAALVLALASCTVGRALGEELYEVELGLEARVDSARLDAAIVAGGRLLMRAERSAGGALLLSLVRELEAPWKLYHVDPLGPFGRQTKLATVVSLDEASWAALDERREEVADFATARHAQWSFAGRRGKPSLDGVFAFVVIGSPLDRFTVEVDSAGSLVAVENRLTDRWLNGGFDRFIGAWGGGSVTGGLEGYWFWNRGERQPFSWEPNTYRALAAALELLDTPAGVEPESGAARDPWTRAGRVVESLFPRARGRFKVAGEAPVTYRAEAGATAGGGRLVDSRLTDAEGWSATRRTVWRPGTKKVESDRLEVELAGPAMELDLVIGYRPVAATGGDEREVPAPGSG